MSISLKLQRYDIVPTATASICLFLAACQDRPASLEAPLPTSPSSGAATFTPAPSLRWEPVEGAEDYRVQLSRDAGFATGLIEDRTPIARYVAGRGLEPGIYHWRVAAVVGGRAGQYSAPSRFTVRSHDKVFPVPADADLATMQRIVGEAAAQAPARVVFAEGAEYRLAPERRVFSLSGVSDLEIDGNGATFVITNPVAGFIHFNRCQRVTLRNVTIDYDPVPFSVGTVLSVDKGAGTITVRADPGMAEFDAPHMLKSWGFGLTLDATTPGRMKTGSLLVVSAGSNLVREGDAVVIPLESKNAAATFAPGDKYVHFARNGTTELFAGDQSDELVFLDNTVYAAPAGHHTLLRCSDAKVLGCRKLIRPGRWYAGNADGVHVRSSKIGPWVEGCTFEGIGDDAVAIYSKGIVVLEKISDTTLRLDKEFFSLEPGSSFVVFDPWSGTPVAEDLTVKTVTDVPQSADFPAHKLVEFSPGFAGDLAASFREAPVVNAGTPREKHEQRIKDAWRHLQVFDRSAQHDRLMVRRNVMKQVRRFGVIIRAENGAVEENEFVQTSDAAVTLHNEPYFWRNGLHSRKILIQNNTMRDCNFTKNSRVPGSISVVLRRLASTERGESGPEVASDWRGHRGITIRGNTIGEWRQNAIWVQSAEDVEIRGNKIEAPLPPPDGTGNAVAIHLENVHAARVAGNTVTPSPFLAGKLQQVGCQDVNVAP